MILCYIAGKYRASTIRGVLENIRAAEAAAVELWAAGIPTLTPHLNTRLFDGVAPDEVFLAGTLEMMRRCDAVIALPGWRESVGATAEIAEAIRLGLHVAAWDEVRTVLPGLLVMLERRKAAMQRGVR